MIVALLLVVAGFMEQRASVKLITCDLCVMAIRSAAMFAEIYADLLSRNLQ